MSSNDPSSLHRELHESFMRHSRAEIRRKVTLEAAAERQLSQSSDAVADIADEVDYFQENLRPDEEARLVIIGGPAGTMIFPTAVAALGMDRIRFEGTDERGSRVTVMQHVSQLNIMLKAVKVDKGEARRIGFHSEDSGDT